MARAASMLGAAGLLFLASDAQAFISTPLGLTSYSPRLALSFSPRPNRVSTTLFSSTKMQEVRGICPICNEPVLSNQPRETDDDGVYFHSACVDAKMLNEGLVRMSERELDQLKAAAAGQAPKAAAATRQAPAAKAGGGGLFGGLFGGGGGGGGGGAEVVELPGMETAGAGAPTSMDALDAKLDAFLPPPAATTAAPPPAPPPARSAWLKATDPASGAPYWYNEETGESSWTPPPGAPVPPPAGPPPTQVVGPSKQIADRMDMQPGKRVVPQPGMTIPFYWQEGIEYDMNRRNSFQMDEIVAIRRTDGDIKFGVINKVSPGREGNVYDVQVDTGGSYQGNKSADGIYKILYDVKSEGFKLELRAKQDEAPKGLFGW